MKNQSRRNFVKKSTAIGGALAVSPAFGFNILKGAKPQETIIGHGEYQYKVVKDWAKMSTAHNPIFNCHEMVMDSQGRLLMIGDHTENNVLVFDKSGKLLDYWGTRYPGGHGLTLSKEGEEDFLFITDCGWYNDRKGKWHKQAGVVSKTSLEGRLIFNLPDPRLVGIYQSEGDFMPTETATAENGDIYVADGYGSDFILQYNHKGEFIRKFGGKNNDNPAANLANAHGVAVDYRDKDNPILVVTSRADNCFKHYTLEGNYLKTVPMPGLFVCRPVIDENNLYAGVCWSKSKEDNERKPNTGFVTIMEGDKVVSNPGGTAPEYKNGELQQIYQEPTGIFHHGHDVCIDEDKNLYVCQWNANQTPPVKLERVG